MVRKVKSPRIEQLHLQRPLSKQVTVNSKDILSQSETEKITVFESRSTVVHHDPNGGRLVATPQSQSFELKIDMRAPQKVGLMLVGLGGNNGSTLAASLLAHRHNVCWQTKRGVQQPTFYGSLIMASSVYLGQDAGTKRDVYVPFADMAPFVDPKGIVIGGWDINDANLAEAVERAQVLEPDLQRQLKPHLESIVPLPSYYHPDFIASNQADRANNLLSGSKSEILSVLRSDIKRFKTTEGLDKVIVMWTANTERYTKIDSSVHLKADDLLAAIDKDHFEISPSTLFAVAAVQENCIFINGSPQNTLVPAVVEMAEKSGVPIAGDDFKSGQTKLKSVLADFLVSSGIKPVSIVSYNHLGNNDGRNLAEAAQFRSKEISKSSVIDDILEACPMYCNGSKDGSSKEHNNGPDHRIVIEYIPAVGDSKRAMDEYESEIFMGGRSTISIHNICEDSLLAAPLMLDLFLLAELLSRISVRRTKEVTAMFSPLHPVLSLLSFMLKAPLVPDGLPVVNAFMRQRRAIETLVRAINGLPPVDDLALEQRI